MLAITASCSIYVIGNLSGAKSVLKLNDHITANNRKTTSIRTSIQPPKATNSHKAAANSIRNATVAGCGNIPPVHEGIDNSSQPELRKLAEYEEVCGGSVAKRLMYFTDMPASIQNAKTDAQDMASTLKAFSAYSIKPLVIVEPVTEQGSIDFKAYAQGQYDTILNTYFSGLKGSGIDDAMMGMWVYFPEANIPEWGAPDPQDYANNVTRTVKIQKNYFPSSQSSIMLDSESYPAGDTNWGDGSYVSLSPYTGGIPKGVLDSFGYQGFPWTPPANQNEASSLDPSEYLNPSEATEAAKTLGVSSVWLNTGTFGQMYAANPKQTVSLTPSQRQIILSSVIAQAQQIQAQGFSASINLFSQDKSADPSEATDWSYWKAGQYSSSNATYVFANFVRQANQAGIGLWLFDTY